MKQPRPYSSRGKTDAEFYPLRFQPVYKDYIWGGTRILKMFDRPPQAGACAESWEVSDRPEGMSIVLNGRHAGKSLQELVMTMGRDLTGADHDEVFPLLIKLIDARERLSVQVHPNDKTAAKYGGEAKTEMWYVLDAAPGAKVFAGLARGVNRERFERALQDERLDAVLQPVPADVGRSIFIPGGRVHAIGEGCVILEVQQNSNTTYRVYDWGRLGHDGRPRELHIKQAFQCINWRDRGVPALVPVGGSRADAGIWTELVACPYFHVARAELGGAETIENDGQSFEVLFTLSGHVAIECGDLTETTGPGISCLMPAALRQYRLTPISGTACVIRIRRQRPVVSEG